VPELSEDVWDRNSPGSSGKLLRPPRTLYTLPGIYPEIHLSFNKPYTVFKGHMRIIDYVEDSCRTWANIVDNFIPGEVYNVGGRPEWEMDIKEYSDLILKAVGRDDSLVHYEEAEPFTTKVKHMDFSKAVRDLKHNPRVTPEEGVKRTVAWMKSFYRVN
jgi:dTDP-glucose 4,6-dehydratase